MRLPNSRKRLILIYLQLHVLSYTLHTLLDKMSESLLPGDLDSSLQGLVEVSCLFIFFLLRISSPSLENLSCPCYVVDKFLQSLIIDKVDSFMMLGHEIQCLHSG